MAKLVKRIALTVTLYVLEAADYVATELLRSTRASDWANARWERAYRRLDSVVNGSA